mgnify:FL=1
MSSLIPEYPSTKPSNKLLYIMFHIGIRPFDQVSFFLKIKVPRKRQRGKEDLFN